MSADGRGEVRVDGRISRRFAGLRQQGRGGLIAFVTAGDPDLGTSMDILRRLPGAGADLIELGMPFSDPMAEGPPVQMASQRALKAGQTMAKDQIIVMNLCGRGDKDVFTVAKHLGMDI